VHGGGATRGCGPAEAAQRGGEEEAVLRWRRRCLGPRGSSRTGRDAQGRAVPRGLGDARGCGVAVAASPRSAPPGEISRASSLFPSLPSFSSSFLVSLGRLSQQTTFAARYRAQSLPSLYFPLGVPPACSISHAYQGWRPPHPPWRPEDAFGRLGGRLAPEADAIRILARRGGRLPPRGRLDV
jgi:hypothetical protein